MNMRGLLVLTHFHHCMWHNLATLSVQMVTTLTIIPTLVVKECLQLLFSLRNSCLNVDYLFGMNFKHQKVYIGV